MKTKHHILPLNLSVFPTFFVRFFFLLGFPLALLKKEEIIVKRKAILSAGIPPIKR